MCDDFERHAMKTYIPDLTLFIIAFCSKLLLPISSLIFPVPSSVYPKELDKSLPLKSLSELLSSVLDCVSWARQGQAMDSLA